MCMSRQIWLKALKIHLCVFNDADIIAHSRKSPVLKHNLLWFASIFRPISSHTEIHFRQTIFIVFFLFLFLLLSISLSWKHLRILCLWLNDSDGITELVYPFLPTVRVLAAQTFTKIQLHQFLRIAITHLRLIQIETISQWLLAGWLCHGGGLKGGGEKQIFFFRLIVFYCNRKRCWDLKRQHSAEMNVTIE